MTIECAIKEIKEDIDLYIPLHGTIDDVDRELPDGRLITALEMAIKSLEEWKKVKAEIEELEKSYGFDKATKYGNKDEKQMDLSYSTMFMYEIADLVDEIKEIIDKHLQEIKNG